MGVVGNVKGFTVFREMALETTPTLYVPFSQAPTNTAHVLVRFSGDGQVQEASLFVEFVERGVGAVDAIEPRNRRGNLRHVARVTGISVLVLSPIAHPVR